MFESLTDKLELTFKRLRGQGRITETNIDDALRDVRLALLEADVHLKVVKTFLDAVKAKAMGQEVLQKSHARAAVRRHRARRTDSIIGRRVP